MHLRSVTSVEEARIADVPTKSLEAHDLFLRGRELILGRKWTREIFDLARRAHDARDRT